METLARLIVDIPRLAQGGEHLVGDLPPETLDYGENDAGIAPVSPLHYDLQVQVLGDELLVRGSASQTIQALCSRCGTPFQITAKEPDFLQSFQIVAGNELLDLTPALREGIILALPTYPVCADSCKGLCVHCGANLNKGTCSCGDGVTPDSHWAALDKLTL
ncbi:MAG: DUF177 domain-containing protein [Kiritimatiellia bacterium]|nr:DUF177 domain-containing protein [Kiritimatiellia bacterium]